MALPQSARMQRAWGSGAINAAWWLLPVAFLFWLYRDAFSTWFVADDFAWLSLLRQFRARHDLFFELFAPMAQGTIRPWSERGLFMGLESLFGLNQLPFRVVAFATASADLLLIAWITRRATRQAEAQTSETRLAGLIAGILWTANTALVRPVTWSSSYNELMCPLFLLAALGLFIRYAETGERKFWWWQLVVFSLGFGALEINIVYPAIAAAWILFQSPHSNRAPLLRSIAPIAGISLVYFVVHRIAAPIPGSGPYTLHFDLSMFKTLALYCKWSLAPEPMERFGHRHITTILCFWIVFAAVAGYVIAELRRRRFGVLFCLAWFSLTLAPMVPLSDHRTDYYLTIPFIGIAMIGGMACARYWSGSQLQRALLAIPVTVYLCAMLPVTGQVAHWWRIQSQAVRTVVLGVVAAHKTHPGKAILLDGITTDLFDLSVSHSPFVAAEVDNVYLTPGSELNITPLPGLVDMELLVPPAEAIWHGITHDEVVVYSVESSRLRNITEQYARELAGHLVDRLPDRVDAGNFLFSWLLGPQWLPPVSGVRWMPGRATLRIGVPAGGKTLELDGVCPEPQLLVAPRHLKVLVNGTAAADTRIYDPETTFRRLFPMSAVLTGKKTVDIEIRVDPVDRKDGQEYGLVFGKIAIRP